MLLPTTDETEGSVPRERSEEQYQEDEGKLDADSLPSTIDYPEIRQLILLFFYDPSWCFLSETSKLASNTASFSFVVNMDRMKTLHEEETSPFTLAVLADMVGDEAREACCPIPDEILLVALARTIPQHVKEAPVYRVSGVKPGSRKPKAKNRARKEVSQLETVPRAVSRSKNE